MIRPLSQPITVSMCINAVAVTLSVLGLLGPVTGALVHNAGSVLVVLNAALLYDRKFDSKADSFFSGIGKYNKCIGKKL